MPHITLYTIHYLNGIHSPTLSQYPTCNTIDYSSRPNGKFSFKATAYPLEFVAVFTETGIFFRFLRPLASLFSLAINAFISHRLPNWAKILYANIAKTKTKTARNIKPRR